MGPEDVDEMVPLKLVVVGPVVKGLVVRVRELVVEAMMVWRRRLLCDHSFDHFLQLG